MEDGVPDPILAGYTVSSFITTSATQDVFELVLARSVVTSTGEHGGLVHLWWRAPLQGNRLVQIYVDEVLYDVTLDVAVRDMYMVLDRSHQHRIELLAVPVDDPDAVWRPQPDLLRGWNPGINSAARIELVRAEDLPVDTDLAVLVDGKDMACGPMWPGYEARAGSWSAEGATYNEPFGLGLGIGDLGAGPLGYDGTSWRWWRSDLNTGSHDVRFTAEEQAGCPVSVPLDVTFLTEHLPCPATHLSIVSPFGIAWEPAG